VNFELAIKDRAPFCDKAHLFDYPLVWDCNLQLYHTGQHLVALIMGCSNFFLPSKDEREVDKKDQILGSSFKTLKFYRKGTKAVAKSKIQNVPNMLCPRTLMDRMIIN
jgi:hypothetical protein